MGKAQKLKQQRKEEEERRRQEARKKVRHRLAVVALSIAIVAVTVGLIFLVDHMKKNEADSPPEAPEAWQEEQGEAVARALDSSVPTVPDEIAMPNVTGAVAMAKPSDPETMQPLPDSASNEFYILKSDAAWLDSDFTVFGQVVEGMDVVNSLTAEDSLDLSEVSGGEGEGGPGSEWVLTTSRGTVVIRFFEEEAPLTTRHIKDLTGQGFYNGLKWYRVEDWVVQTGSHYRSLPPPAEGTLPLQENIPSDGR